MKPLLASAVIMFTAASAAAFPMSPRDMLFDPKTKEQFKELSKEDRVESLGQMLELTNREKELTTRQLSKRAYQLEECVMKNIDEKRYKDKDVMTPVSDCVVTLGFD